MTAVFGSTFHSLLQKLMIPGPTISSLGHDLEGKQRVVGSQAGTIWSRRDDIGKRITGTEAMDMTWSLMCLSRSNDESEVEARTGRRSAIVALGLVLPVEEATSLKGVVARRDDNFRMQLAFHCNIYK